MIVSNLKKKNKIRTDKQRIDWLEKKSHHGIALVNDDNGHWAIAFDGWQNCPTGKRAIDIQTTFIIEKKEWKKSVREAIDAAIKEEK